MEDLEVIAAFVHDGAKRAFGPTLHIEGDCLFYDGWWQASFRVADDAFSVRDEPPPGETTALDDIATALAGRGFENVPFNSALLYAITYTDIALGLVAWAFWSTDTATANAALAKRAGHDEFLTDATPEASGGIKEADYSAELGGARRNAGLPPSIVLTVGIPDEHANVLRDLLDDCRIEARALGQIRPEACGSLIPTAVVVYAADAAGQEFAMELRAAACGRFLPVLTLTADGTPVPGSDAGLPVTTPPEDWVDTIRGLLP